MYYLFFKDNSIYEKSKHTIMLTTHQIEQEPIEVDIQKVSSNGNWHSGLPNELYFEQLEKSKTGNKEIDISIDEKIKSYDKYRNWHKRRLYTVEQFNATFIIASKC